MKKKIVEKVLGISGDYQYKALRSRNFLQKNWHKNKWFVIDELIHKYKPRKVLDLGTGSGNFELIFSKKLNSIVGVDYNDEALKFLRVKLDKKGIKNVKLINKNIADISLISNLGKFDMIILVDVIEHLDSDSGDKLISGFKRFLSSEGKIVIITPNYSGFWPIIERYIIDKFTQLPHLEKMQHLTRYNKDFLSKSFKKQGYKLDYYSTFNTFSYLFPTKFLSKFLCGLEIKFAFPFGNLLLCVYELK